MRSIRSSAAHQPWSIWSEATNKYTKALYRTSARSRHLTWNLKSDMERCSGLSF